MWNPTVALGTVTHEYIGYLLPMGPFFVVFHLLGVPVWVAQRLWLGSILFAAGAGIPDLSPRDGPARAGPDCGGDRLHALPYFLQYAGRISVILLPWAGLPSMLPFAIVALRRGGWREPALFAIVVALVSGINGAHHLRRRGAHPVAPLRRGRAARVHLAPRPGDGFAHRGLDVGGVPVVDGGARVEAAYGVNTLKFTETVSSTSQPPTRPRSCGAWATGTSTAQTTSGRGPAPPSASPSRSACWRPPMPYPCSARRAPRSSAGGSGPSSSCSSSSAWCSRSGPSRTRPHAGRWSPQGLHGEQHGRAGPALDRSGDAGRAPRAGHAPGQRAHRPVAAALHRRDHDALLVAVLVVANNPSLFNGEAISAGSLVQPASLPSYQLAAIKHLNATHPGRGSSPSPATTSPVTGGGTPWTRPNPPS